MTLNQSIPSLRRNLPGTEKKSFQSISWKQEACVLYVANKLRFLISCVAPFIAKPDSGASIRQRSEEPGTIFLPLTISLYSYRQFPETTVTERSTLC